jgi:hypothetical protein
VPKAPRYPEIKAFFDDYKKAIGAKGQRDVARVLGLAETDKESNVGRWANGTNEPRFHVTMQLLKGAGWLTDDALRAYREPQPRGVVTLEQSEQALRRVEPAKRDRAAKADRRGRR